MRFFPLKSLNETVEPSCAVALNFGALSPSFSIDSLQFTAWVRLRFRQNPLQNVIYNLRVVRAFRFFHYLAHKKVEHSFISALIFGTTVRALCPPCARIRGNRARVWSLSHSPG